MENYCLKCDISGIQSFIFNVPSEGAARALKSHSVYVQKITDDCLKKLKEFFGNNNATELYNGGGNFYLKIKTDKSEADIQNFIDKSIYDGNVDKDIFAYVSFVKDENTDIAELLNAVNTKVQLAKLQRPVSYDLLSAKPIQVEDVDTNTIKGINGQVPDGDFKWIANKSEGDSKLAALKLDVDNLGMLFRDRSEEDYKKLSISLKKFFDGNLLQLIEELKMQQNIYVVFSGGDDCFLIGTWEKVFKLAIELQQKFAVFQTKLKEEITSLPKEDITFSAGIVVFQPHFPMLQLAVEVEDALSASKRAKGKNSITVFGKTLNWIDFKEAQKLSKTFNDLINNADEKEKESKSLLQIFRLIYPQNTEKKEIPKVWQLKYYLRRNVKKINETLVKQIFDEYSQALLQKHINYQGNGKKNSNIYLVASRWAELLTRN
jgi:CRISPR-associated protein Csm1